MTPNKKSRQWVVRLVRTIVGIFAECCIYCPLLRNSPPSDKKLLSIAYFAKLPYRTPCKELVVGLCKVVYSGV